MAFRSPGPAPAVEALVTPLCGSGPGRCEVGDALRLVSKAHVLDMLHLLAARSLRFGELRRELRANANVVSVRLKDLAEAGLVVRAERSRGAEYEATARGRELLRAMEPLQAWAGVTGSEPTPAL